MGRERQIQRGRAKGRQRNIDIERETFYKRLYSSVHPSVGRSDGPLVHWSFGNTFVKSDKNA